MNFEGNNEQHKVPSRFAELRAIQTQKKNELRSILLNEYCHLLPEELWEIILTIVFSDQTQDQIAYFVFKRKDNLYNDDHYIFEGTEKAWSFALAKMRSIVNPNDQQDDIPTDTYCSGMCEYLSHKNETTTLACPDELGNKCECRWTHRVFASHAESLRYRCNWIKIPLIRQMGKNSILLTLNY